MFVRVLLGVRITVTVYKSNLVLVHQSKRPRELLN